MMVAAPTASPVAPSTTASAYPRMEVSGVRNSWDTDRRNWRSCSRARARSSPMVLMASASCRNSRSSPLATGTRADRSPPAIRPVADTAATSGRVNRRARARATRAATVRATMATHT